MTEDIQKFDLLILGSGICAQSILFELSKSDRFDLDTLKIGQVSGDTLTTPCSLNSTSVVSLSGTSRGMSPLGDLIVDSYHYTVNQIMPMFDKNFYPAKQFFIYDERKDEAQFLRRNKEIVDHTIFDYKFRGNQESCFILDNEGLLNDLSNEIDTLSLTKINDTIVDVSYDKYVTLLSGKKLYADKIVCALGAYSNQFLNNMDHDHLNRSKVVPGDYLVFQNVDIGEESLVITMGHYNLVYRAYSKTILIGGTSLRDEWSAVDYVELRPLYDFFKNIIKTLPDFSKGEVKTGLRFKGRRRRPFLGEIKDSIYSFHGVYKNGFTFSFYMAREFVKGL